MLSFLKLIFLVAFVVVNKCIDRIDEVFLYKSSFLLIYLSSLSFFALMVLLNIN